MTSHTNVISANQHVASTFSMQIFKFQRRSSPSFSRLDTQAKESSRTKGQKPFPPTSIENEGYLTIIPRAGMGSESIAHEAEGRMGY